MKNTIFICLYLISSLVFAQNTETIVVTDKNDLLLVGKQVYFLEDKSGKMTIEDVLKPENQARFNQNMYDIFKPKSSDYYHYWLKLTIENRTEAPLWIELDNSFLLYVDYYCQSEGKYAIQTQTGSFRPAQNKPFASNVFLLPLADSLLTQTVYLRIYLENPAPTPLYVGTLETFSQNKALHDYIFGAFIGLVLIMFAYNLFLYFAIRDGVYPWYLGYLLMLFLFLPFLNNYPFIADWFGEDLRRFWFDYVYTWSFPFFFFVGIFFMKFLGISKKYTFIYYALFSIIALRSAIIPFLNLTGLISPFVLGLLYQFVVIIFYLFLFLSSTYLWLRYKNQNAFYHFLAWSGFMVGVVVAVLSTQGILPYNYASRNATFFGAGWEILMFAFALASRVNIMRQEKQVSEIALLEKIKENEKLLREQNEILEKTVNAKTSDLQVAYEEIRTANLELAQTQTETIFQKEILEIKNMELEGQKYKINQSIESAKLIQHAILPTLQKMESIFVEHFVLFMPKDTVSGDFYTLNQIDNKKLLIVADCTGHGVSGAFMTLIGSALLDRIVNMANIHDPKMILEKLHNEIQMVLQQKETGNKDGMDAIVVLLEEITNLVGFENPQSKVTFSGAKRPLYYLIEGEKEVQKIAGSRKMIGGFESTKKEFVNQCFNLPKNSLLYLFTDGYADQNNQERKKFSEARVLKILNENQSLTLENQKDVLQTEILQFMGKEEQRDDILIVGVRV